MTAKKSRKKNPVVDDTAKKSTKTKPVIGDTAKKMRNKPSDR